MLLIQVQKYDQYKLLQKKSVSFDINLPTEVHTIVVRDGEDQHELYSSIVTWHFQIASAPLLPQIQPRQQTVASTTTTDDLLFPLAYSTTVFVTSLGQSSVREVLDMLGSRPLLISSLFL